MPGACSVGHPAPLAKAEIRHANGEHKTIPSKGVFSLRAGDRVRCWIAGGAGYGDPLARPSSTVLQDVIDRKISLAAARDEYGVVIDPKTRTIDETATAELRREHARQRGPIDWTFDRGEGDRQ